MGNKKSFLLFLVFSIVFLIYSPSLKNWFIWDDFHLVVDEEIIRSFNNLPLIFKTHLFQDAGGSNFYRPLQTLSFMFDYFLWGLNPFGYHLTSLILHLLNIILIYFFVSRIFKSPNTGFLAGLIFGLHPVNTEAVTYIAGRADPLSCAFFLSAFLLYMKFKDSERRFSLFFFSILFFLFSLLTKESVLIFPLVLIIYDVFILRQDSVNKKSIMLYTPYFLIIVLYIFFRLFIMGLPLGLLKHFPFNVYLFTMSKIFILYLGLLFFPLNLHMERIESLAHSIRDPQAAVSLLTILCLIWFSILVHRRSRRLFFFIGFFLITLLPMFNILTINALMAEHWLYLSSIGVYAIVAFGFVKILDLNKSFVKQTLRGKLTVFILIGFLGFFSIRTIFRNIEWGDPIRFYKNMLRYCPHSARGHLNLGSIYMSAKNYKLAREAFQTALKFNPGDAFGYYALGFLEYVENNKLKARKIWKKGLDAAPFYRPTHTLMNRALYADNKRFRRLLRAADSNPKNIMANYRLSSLYLKNSLYIEGLDRLERILEINPNYVNAIFNKGWVYLKLGLYTNAIKEYEKVIALSPNDADTYLHLSFCYVALEQHKKAEMMLQKARALEKK